MHLSWCPLSIRTGTGNISIRPWSRELLILDVPVGTMYLERSLREYLQTFWEDIASRNWTSAQVVTIDFRSSSCYSSRRRRRTHCLLAKDGRLHKWMVSWSPEGSGAWQQNSHHTWWHIHYELSRTTSSAREDSPSESWGEFAYKASTGESVFCMFGAKIHPSYLYWHWLL